jgi:UDP-GlcNAc:undecaprenyl-phosphate GlcNAc-1-phosphate transferase
MAARYISAFVIALALALAATPWFGRIAVRFGIVDHPAARKVHHTPTPYLGGCAFILAASVGLALSGGVPARVVFIAVAALGLALVGAADDKLTLAPWPRLAAQAAAAGVAIVAGVRGYITGLEGVDIALVALWLVGITNAINFLDNMDGLAGGTAAIAGAGIFVIAAAAGEHIVAATAAGLVGGCLGFLAYNKRPASIFMGDAGALFLGFGLAVLSVEVDSKLHRPDSFLLPILLLALPIVDTTTAVVGRLRAGRKITKGGKDHLSHRLVARGLSHSTAVFTLLMFEAAATGAAVALDHRSVVGCAASGAAAVVVAGVLWQRLAHSAATGPETITMRSTTLQAIED